MPVVNAAAAKAAVAPQANAEYEHAVRQAMAAAKLGAIGNQGILGMGGVNYLGAVSGTQTYSANQLTSH